MNKEQRKSLNKFAEQLGRIVDELSDIYSGVEEVKSEEESKLDNLPDSLRYSDKGEEIEEGIERLDEVLDLLNDCAYSDAAELLSEF